MKKPIASPPFPRLAVLPLSAPGLVLLWLDLQACLMGIGGSLAVQGLYFLRLVVVHIQPAPLEPPRLEYQISQLLIQSGKLH